MCSIATMVPMETTIVYWGYIGRMEKNLEATIYGLV